MLLSLLRQSRAASGGICRPLHLRFFSLYSGDHRILCSPPPRPLVFHTLPLPLAPRLSSLVHTSMLMSSFRSTLQLFDVDGNGVITRDEFRKGLQALTSLTGSPITDMQADELMRALDRDGSGTIDYGEVSFELRTGARACRHAMLLRRCCGGLALRRVQLL